MHMIDDFSEEYYQELLKNKNTIVTAASKQSTKSACIQQMVSQNRMRYLTEEFNLDLAYISKRVIAMGYPASGIRSIYRNPLGQVLEFFRK